MDLINKRLFCEVSVCYANERTHRGTSWFLELLIAAKNQNDMRVVGVFISGFKNLSTRKKFFTLFFEIVQISVAHLLVDKSGSIELGPKHQSGEFRCSWEVKLRNSINLVVHVSKQWPVKRHISRWKAAPTNTPNSAFWWSIMGIWLLGALKPILPTHIRRGTRSFSKFWNMMCLSCCILITGKLVLFIQSVNLSLSTPHLFANLFTPDRAATLT